MKISELSTSEKRLVGVVATLAALLLNLLVAKFFLNTRSQLAQQAVQKTTMSDSLKLLVADAPMWEERANWLQKSQPKLENDVAEGNALLNALKENASKHGVTLSKQQLVPAKNETGAVAVPVQFEVKANWKNLCGFLNDLQGPDRFIVIQQSRLRIDPADATQMLCDMTVAKWFAAR
jgi:Tfp pilus assembly protein PilO